MSHSQARQTRPNSGGVAEGYPRFDKGGGVAIIFYFLRVKNRTRVNSILYDFKYIPCDVKGKLVLR